jgi:hypothetical protein
MLPHTLYRPTALNERSARPNWVHARRYRTKHESTGANGQPCIVHLNHRADIAIFVFFSHYCRSVQCPRHPTWNHVGQEKAGNVVSNTEGDARGCRNKPRSGLHRAIRWAVDWTLTSSCMGFPRGFSSDGSQTNAVPMEGSKSGDTNTHHSRRAVRADRDPSASVYHAMRDSRARTRRRLRDDGQSIMVCSMTSECQMREGVDSIVSLCRVLNLVILQ